MRIEYKIDPFGPDGRLHSRILKCGSIVSIENNFFLNDQLIANMKRKEKG
jgi:hypothetical protein